MATGSIASDEGSLPSENSDEVKATSIWFRIDGLLKRMQDLMSNRSSERGPVDYDPSDQVLRDLHRAIVNLNRPPLNHNGDDGGIKPWHLAISTVGLMITIVLMTYLLSSQVESTSIKIDRILKQVKAQDERISSLEKRSERADSSNP